MKMGVLNKQRSFETANNLLKVVQAFFSDISIYELSYSIEDDYKEQQTYCEFEWDEEEKGVLKKHTYNSYTKQKERTEKIVIGASNTYKVKYKCGRKSNDEEAELTLISRNNTYCISYNGKKYEINIYNSPEDCGYRSVLSQYDKDTYLLLGACQIRLQDGSVEKEMYFGFDIVNMTFLELFDIYSINTKGYYRECKSETLEIIQGKLVGRKLKQ